MFHHGDLHISAHRRNRLGELPGKIGTAQGGIGALERLPLPQLLLAELRKSHDRDSHDGCTCCESFMAGFSTTRTAKPVQKTLLRIRSPSKCGGSVSGLRSSSRRRRQKARPMMLAASTKAV